MLRASWLVLLLAGASVAAPVPKEKPDPLPDGALVRLGSARFRGPWTDGVVFSKDGKTLYTVRWNVVRRWEAESGKPLDPIDLGMKWTAVKDARIWGDRAFVLERPANGRYDSPHTVRVFDLPAGKEVNSFEVAGSGYFTSFGYTQPPAGASDDGKRFALTDSQGKSLTVLDVGTGKTVAEFTLADKQVATKRHLSATGKLAVAVGSEGITVFDVGTKKELSTLPGLFGLTEGSPDEKTLVSARYVELKGGGGRRAQGELVAWDVATGKVKHTLPLAGDIWHTQFCGNEAVIVGHNTSHANAHRGIALTRWNLTTGKADWTVPAAFQVGGSIMSAGWIAVSPDQKRVMVSNRESLMVVYDAATGKRVDENTAHSEAVEWAGFSADGKTVTTLTERDIRVWDAETGELKTATVPKELNRTDFAGVTNDLFVWFERSPDFEKTEVIAWDRKANKLVWKADAELGRVGRVLAGGERVVALGGAKSGSPETAVVFDQNGKKLHAWPLPKSTVYDTTSGLAADTLYLPASDRKKPSLTAVSLKTGEAATGIDLPPGESFRGAVNLVTPTASGDAVVLRAAGTGWAVADTKTGEVLHDGRLAGRSSTVAAVSPDGSKVAFNAAFPPGVVVYELKRQGKASEFDSKGAGVSAITFSPDGKKAVVGYRDGTALIWDVSK